MSVADIIRDCQSRLDQLQQQRLLREPRVVDALPGGRCRINGSELLNFGGNDYINLSHEIGTSETVQRVFRNQVGATASALVAGRSSWHHQLEQALATFEETEAALLFPSGYAANVGVLTSLVKPGDAVFSDRDNHASIIDAIKACPGKLHIYRRNDLQQLKAALGKRRPSYERVFIVTDGVFSMDGEVAPLKELCDIADEYNAVVIVDEAHGTGVLGDHGRGATDYCNVEERVLLRVGTLSKAMGGIGGFAVACQPIVDVLRNSARTQFFSTALPPGICAAMLESLRTITEEPERRQQLAAHRAFAQRRMAELNLETVGIGVAPIVPVLIGDDATVVSLSQNLQNEGWFVPAIRPPTVPQGTARLRVSLTAAHTESQIDELLCAIESHATKGKRP